jgi:hypothetical protein
VEIVSREDQRGLDLDAKVELIRSLVPLGLVHVQELLDDKVKVLAEERYARGNGCLGCAMAVIRARRVWRASGCRPGCHR